MDRSTRQHMLEGGGDGSATMPPPVPGAGNSRQQGPGKREVDLYVRTYTTLLQSSGAIGVSSLEPAHITASSSLHAGAGEAAPDMNAFMYSTQRLPSSIVDVEHILLGQSARDFAQAGFSSVAQWNSAAAPGRRRKWLYDAAGTLAAYIASASDLDDLIPTIVAYQIEWNKFHRHFRQHADLAQLVSEAADGSVPADNEIVALGEQLQIGETDWVRLQTVWGDRFWSNLAKMAAARKRVSLRLLGGSHLGYARSTRHWWEPVAALLEDLTLTGRPYYFVSSNTHSIVNVLSGMARKRDDLLTQFIRAHQDPELVLQLERLEGEESRASRDNLLYFAARQYYADPARTDERQQRTDEEEALGIYHLEPTGAMDVGVQIIDLAKLEPGRFDPRLAGGADRHTETVDPDDGLHADAFDPRAEGSDAVIININYPLGLAAYHILSQVGMATDALRGVYILGKAATLNGRIGDVMIADVVYDEHSGNTYWFDNCFSYQSLAPYLVFGAALDNQKAVTVKGTYLQNQGYLDFYYRENYTVVEMEAGPFLNAVYEDVFLRRYPAEDAINLRLGSPDMVDLGVLHYASDTPYTRAQTLGARGLSFFGMDSTYASTIAILRRIFDRERVRLATDAGSL
ncbi:MAG: DUF6909 family protein [Thermomicrobiales bacterium]